MPLFVLLTVFSEKSQQISEVESTGTFVMNDVPEGYSNPIAELGYKVLTHSSEEGMPDNYAIQSEVFYQIL